MLLIAGALTIVFRYVRVSPDKPSDFSVIPLSIDGWTGEEYPLSDFTLEVLKATNTTSRRYEKGDDREATLFIGYFEDQKYGSQIHSPKHCLPGGGWGIISSGRHEIEVDGDRFAINRVLIGNKKMRQVVYYWFRTRSGVLSNEYALKLDLVLNSLRLQPTDAALIRFVSSVSSSDESDADTVLMDLLTSLHEPIERSVPFAGSS
jgi:EpsI family protein